jgi:hypothetical protein
MTRLVLLILALSTTGCFPALLSRSAYTPACRDTAGFVGTRGRDTVVLEVAEMTRTRLRYFAYAQGRQTVSNTTTDSALVPLWGNFAVWSVADTAKAVEHGLYELDGDTVWYGSRRLERYDIQHTAVGRGAAIFPTTAIAYEELMTRRARRTGKESVDIPTFSLDRGGDTRIAHVRFIGTDSARVQFGDGDIAADLAIDPVGRIVRAHYHDAIGRPVNVQRVECGVAEDLIAERYRVYNAWFRADAERRKTDR